MILMLRSFTALSLLLTFSSDAFATAKVGVLIPAAAASLETKELSFNTVGNAQTNPLPKKQADCPQSLTSQIKRLANHVTGLCGWPTIIL